MKETISVLIPERDVKKRVEELAGEITDSFGGEQITMVCVLKGAAILAMDLARELKQNVEFDFVELSSYFDGTESSGRVEIKKDISTDIKGKNVLVVEDIIDSGRTMDFLLDSLRKREPKSLKLCSLLDKPERRKFDVKADFNGFEIPDEFVIGYGLDYAQKYRNLPFIGVLNIEK